MMVVMVFEIDQDLYDQVTAVLAPQGLTLSDALSLFMHEVATTGTIPFTYTQEDLDAAIQSDSVRLVEEYLEEG